MAVTEPTITLATVALDCLSMAVSGNPNPPLNVCFRVGKQIAHDLGQFTDLCCEGLAYVSLGDTFPTESSFPQQDTASQVQGSCGPATWGQVIRLGIVRCVPVGDQNGEPPTCADWNSAFIQNAYDSASLRRATCCLRSWFLAASDFYLGMSIVIDRQVQVDPNGGCVERYVDVTVQFPNCDC